MNKIFLTLSFLMGFVVLASNYLVQFPIKYYGLQDLLTYGAFSYPVAFLITDLANRSFGKLVARKISNELIILLKNKGFKNVSEAIGTKN